MLDPEALQFTRDHAGGAHFLERQFGVGMDVAADFDQRRLDPLNDGADGGLRVVGGNGVGHAGLAAGSAGMMGSLDGIDKPDYAGARGRRSWLALPRRWRDDAGNGRAIACLNCQKNIGC